MTALPQLASNGPVQPEQTKHRAEEVGGRHPDGCMEKAGVDGVARVLALACGGVMRRLVLIFHTHQEEHRSGGEQGEDPQCQNDILHPTFAYGSLGFERKADGQVTLHAQHSYVKDGCVGATLVEVVRQTTHQLAEHPGDVLPEAVQVKGEAEEDDQVWYGHAGEVQVGGGLHVLEALDEEDGHGIAGHTDDEKEKANDGDRDEGGSWEQRVPPMVVIHVDGNW